MGRHYCMVTSAPGGPYNKASVVRLDAKTADMARKETYVRLLARKLDLDWTKELKGKSDTMDGMLDQFGIHERAIERVGHMTWGPVDTMVDHAISHGRSLNPRILEVVREVGFDMDELDDVRHEAKESIARHMERGQE